MRVLITGAYGFAGHHAIEHYLNTTSWDIVAIYSFRHLGDAERAIKHPRVTNLFHDLNAPFSSRQLDKIGQIDYIIHMAAQSHVERSIQDPVPFVQNNVNATLHMLELARHLMRYKNAPLKAFVQVSTDEVYGPAIHGDKHREWREIVPSNPYAASKAAQEAIAISYWRTYGVPVVITNTMNLCGPRQDAEKYIPMCIKKIFKGETVTIHGHTGAIGSRQYLHAKSHADAIKFVLQNTEITKYKDSSEFYQFPDRYNICGDEEVDNLELAQKIATIMGRELKYELVDFHSARPGHDRRYALDDAKIKALGWVPPYSLKQALQEAVLCNLENREWMA